MIEVGKSAPDVELARHLAGTKFSLAQFQGQKNVTLMFRPLDWTPTLSREVPGLEALKEKFKACDTEVLG